MNDRITYIYALLDPRIDDPIQRVRYVGKTVNPQSRYQCHLGSYVNYYSARWIRSLRRHGVKPEMVILEKTLGDTWKERECWWIAHYRSLGARLTNVTPGGDSAPDLPPEVWARIAIAVAKHLRRLPSRSASGYKGVKQSSRSTWAATFSLNGRVLHIGTYSSPQEAAIARDLTVMKHFGLDVYTNFDKTLYESDELPIPRLAHLSSTNGTGFRGVMRDKESKRWRARIEHEGRLYHVGIFDTPEEAARGYDARAKQFWGGRARLNFPNEENVLNPNRPVRSNSSGYTGVSYHKRSSKWYAYIGTSGIDRRHLGSFDTPEKAAHAHDAAAQLSHAPKTRLNFPEENHAAPLKHPKAASGFYGVYRNPNTGRYRVVVTHNKQQYHCATVDDPAEGARIYDAKARELRGDRSRLNFPDEPMPQQT